MPALDALNSVHKNQIFRDYLDYLEDFQGSEEESAADAVKRRDRMLRQVRAEYAKTYQALMADQDITFLPVLCLPFFDLFDDRGHIRPQGADFHQFVLRLEQGSCLIALAAEMEQRRCHLTQSESRQRALQKREQEILEETGMTLEDPEACDDPLSTGDFFHD